MRSLAAAISPGYFGFTDWALAIEATSEIAAQVPIATRKNNALIIIFLHRRFRACAAVRSLLSAIAYDGRAVHEPREDAMRQVGRQAAGRAPAPLPLRDSTESTRRV